MNIWFHISDEPSTYNQSIALRKTQNRGKVFLHGYSTTLYSYLAQSLGQCIMCINNVKFSAFPYIRFSPSNHSFRCVISFFLSFLISRMHTHSDCFHKSLFAHYLFGFFYSLFITFALSKSCYRLCLHKKSFSLYIEL